MRELLIIVAIGTCLLVVVRAAAYIAPRPRRSRLYRTGHGGGTMAPYAIGDASASTAGNSAWTGDGGAIGGAGAQAGRDSPATDSGSDGGSGDGGGGGSSD